MPGSGEVERPRRRDVVASYDRGVDAYDDLWSPAILPAAIAAIASLGLQPGARVLDVGGGSGALSPSIRSAAQGVEVVTVDASIEMLEAARRVPGAIAVQADAQILPVMDKSVDAVVLAYVLFHLQDPARALLEAARVLRTGGSVATITWAIERSSRADTIWSTILTDVGVPNLPPRRVDTGLDSIAGIESLISRVGLSLKRVWVEQLQYRWEPSSFYELATGSGVNQLRLELVSSATRSTALTRLRQHLEQLEPTDFDWQGEVICGLGTKG
jgi:SAM-dependent methyltransferase